MRILILGAGPTGLGAARRLHALGHGDWELWEQEDAPGGLAGSRVDEHGFVWDLGGHVQFSHYAEFDEAMDQALGPEEWLIHERESWVRSCGEWVPYPFQYNIHRLPPGERERCHRGLIEAAANADDSAIANFEELIRRRFGRGLAALFMLPYNFKVWAWPLSDLTAGWIGDRVALPDLEIIERSLRDQKDNVSWGPNVRFRFPRRGGTGAIWRAIAGQLPGERLHFKRKAVYIDAMAKRVRDADGAETEYDALISSIPLDVLTELCGFENLRSAAARLNYSTVHVVGLGLHGAPGEDLRGKCWMYFPEDNCPFYRATIFSHYSPNNVPDIGRFWSLLLEVSQSPHKPVDLASLEDDVVQGAINTGLIAGRDAVHHVWKAAIPRGYPTPTLRRDQALDALLPALQGMAIYSRGRFGAWKYEVSNQDHSMMQGVEAVDHILAGKPEQTVWFPHIVNRR